MRSALAFIWRLTRVLIQIGWFLNVAGLDVLLVMNLIPKLIPKKYLHRLSKYPHAELEEFENNGIELPQNELKQALNPLADFLLEVKCFVVHIGFYISTLKL